MFVAHLSLELSILISVPSRHSRHEARCTPSVTHALLSCCDFHVHHPHEPRKTNLFSSGIEDQSRQL